ncbi:trigger factor [Beijerinckia mobilis]|uniref:trigger factor n=1 Tax=Beijerinckia mobilis TaxID=231434 RepID=UPI000552259F|nr:trigger factor [Beijerinckia mobilis]
MQVTETLSEGLKREYRVVLPAADIASRLDEQLQEMKAKVRINGFRPGKVPVSHLKRLYGRSVMLDVVQEAINEANRQILEDNKLRPAGEPKIDFDGEKDEMEKAFESTADFAFKVAMEILPQFEIGSLDDITIERFIAEVPEEEVDRIVERFANQNRPYEPRPEGEAAEKGDKVTIDFVGKVDGEAFEGGTGEDIDLVLGSDTFIPGFEDQVVGVKVGDERQIAVTFPEDYAAKLAGKHATFDIKVKVVSAPGEQKIDDDLAKAFGYETLEAMREQIRNTLGEELTAASRAQWKRALLDELDKKYTFELPEGLVEGEFATVWRKVELDQQRSGKTFEEEGTTEEAARADYRKIAERRVRLGLLLAEIGEKAGIVVPDEEVGKALVERARAFPGQEKMIWDFYRQNPKALNEIRAPLFEDKTVDYILTQAKVTDTKVSKDELFKKAEEVEKDEAAAPEAE